MNPTLLRGGSVRPRPRLRPARDARGHLRAAGDVVLRRPDHARRAEPAARTSTPSTCRRCAPSAPPARRSPSRCCAPGSTAGSPCSRRYGMTEAAPAGTMLDSADAVGQGRVGRASRTSSVDVRVVRPDGTECEPRRDRRGRARPGRTSWPATGTPRGDRGRRSSTAGTAPATPARSTRTATSTSATAIKDMIISGGENVYPAEVESALSSSTTSRRCAVIGVPDDELGRGRPAPSSCPRRAPHWTPRSCAPGCASRLAGFKVPEYVELPTNCPRPPPARSASPTCATATSPPRRTPHEHHHHDHRRAAAP